MTEYTLVVKDNKENVISKLSFKKGESLLLLCQKAGISLNASCNGKGTCGSCKVRFVKGAPMPTAIERQKLSSEELRQGIRLLCRCIPTQDCEIRFPEAEAFTVVTSKTKIGWEPLSMNGVNGWEQDGTCFFVVDIGTTTIVVEKRNKSDGSVIGRYKAINSQRSYGADVLSRMEASLDGKSEELASCIRGQLEEGMEQLGKEDVSFMVVAANTTMLHLLMKYPVEGLARAPFMPVTLYEVVTEIAGVKTYLMPGISAFVGADVLAGLVAIQYMKKEQEKQCTEGYELLIDLGTNAELVLYNKYGGICTATAAGPAFDGDAGSGFLGSDMVFVLAKLYEEKLIDENGTLCDAYFESGVSVPCKEGNLHISQQQIRNLMLAKAAVRAGMEVLMEKKGITPLEIDRVYLAGGFGYYLDIRGAVTIGLLPKELEKKTVACGNTALAGGAVYAYSLMQGGKKGVDLPLMAINLAEEKLFEENYVNYINFES